MVCGTALAVVMVLAVDGTRLDAMVGVGRVWRVWCYGTGQCTATLTSVRCVYVGGFGRSSLWHCRIGGRGKGVKAAHKGTVPVPGVCVTPQHLHLLCHARPKI